MTPAELAGVRTELAECRRRIDLALGRSLQLLDLLQVEMRERQRDERLTIAERSSQRKPP